MTHDKGYTICTIDDSTANQTLQVVFVVPQARSYTVYMHMYTQLNKRCATYFKSGGFLILFSTLFRIFPQFAILQRSQQLHFSDHATHL